MTRVLFVCSGNTCRSPMAELYFNDLCRRAGRGDITSASAGVCAIPGVPIAAAAREALADLGIAAGDFRSRRLDGALLAESDLVVVMAASHRAAVAAAFPECRAPIRMLLEFAGSGASVPDPYGESADVYRRILTLMRPALSGLARHLAAVG